MHAHDGDGGAARLQRPRQRAHPRHRPLPHPAARRQPRRPRRPTTSWWSTSTARCWRARARRRPRPRSIPASTADRPDVHGGRPWPSADVDAVHHGRPPDGRDPQLRLPLHRHAGPPRPDPYPHRRAGRRGRATRSASCRLLPAARPRQRRLPPTAIPEVFLDSLEMEENARSTVHAVEPRAAQADHAGRGRAAQGRASRATPTTCPKPANVPEKARQAGLL